MATPRTTRRTLLRRLAALAALLLLPVPGTAHVDAGEPVPDVELATLDGGRARLLAPGKIGVLVFFRPGNERSQDTLQRLAECEPELRKRAIHLVAVISGGAAMDEARAMVAEAGLKAPVLVDDGDELYGKLELRQHPVVVLVDRKAKVQHIEPYHKLRYCDVLRARIGFALGELDQAGLDRALHPPKAEFPAEVSGGHASHYVNLGKKALAKGDAAGALRAFEAALVLEPGSEPARAGKAMAEQALAGPAPKAAGAKKGSAPAVTPPAPPPPAAKP